jgi:hypothetical protein
MNSKESGHQVKQHLEAAKKELAALGTSAEKDSKKRKEPPVVYVPSEKDKIEHIFKTPEPKTPKLLSPCPSVTSMSSREKANQKLAQLTALLKSNDAESDDSSCCATDLEEFLDNLPEKNPGHVDNDKNNENGHDHEEGEGEGQEEKDDDDDTEEEDEADEGTENSDAEEKTEEEEDEINETDADIDGEEYDEEAEEEETEDKEAEGETGETEGEDMEGEEEEEKEDDEEVPTPAAPPTTPQAATVPDPNEHALVPLTKETRDQNTQMRNSMTDKRAWDTFCRQAKSTHKMPASLSEYFVTNKTKLFNLWCDQGRDWAKCVLVLERKQEQRNTAQRGWVAVQGKDLKKKYATDEQYKKVIADRYSKGLYYDCEDFPDDADDPQLSFSKKFSKHSCLGSILGVRDYLTIS